MGRSRKARCGGHRSRPSVKDGPRVDEARTRLRCPRIRWKRLWTGGGGSLHRMTWHGLQPGACLTGRLEALRHRSWARARPCHHRGMDAITLDLTRFRDLSGRLLE